MRGFGSPSGSGHTAHLPYVSIVIPCRNERKFIKLCLDSVVSGTYPNNRLEVIVADGMSEDGTREIVNRYTESHPYITLIDNSRRVTPAALNAGIRRARGAIIVRMDAHTTYPPDYVEKLVSWLRRSGADNVGGVLETVPGADTARARAVARAMSHPFGVGNAYFRIGTSRPRWVDTVPFGCYRREVFESIGLFDEDLARNQDAELNHRLIRSGGRILLVPDIVSTYYARESLRDLGRMYFQYGYFKPLVIRKLGGVFTLRQVVPAGFLMLLFLAAVISIAFPAGIVVLAVVVGLYAAAVLGASITSRLDPRAAVLLCFAFPVMHFAYGAGFLKGSIDLLIRRRHASSSDQSIPLSR